ncbi:MAG: hypothetical protein JWO25_2390 [Alphaproteobacteria bacterium]|nr:hypothetical protein [Alphaproteobacteria bacterium]
MLRIALVTLAAAVALTGTSAPAQAALGPDAAACNPGSGRPALLVSINGFVKRSGRLRVQVYDNPNTFLEKGAKLRRIDLPVTSGGAMNVCVAVPAPGRYAVAVRHDVDGDNARGDWSDGGGFSNNPSISLFHLKPSYQQTAVAVGNGVRPVNVILNYRHGLSIGPVARS